MTKKLTMELRKQPQAVVTIGLDIGYGVTKAVSDNGTIVFPSIAGRARRVKYQAEELARKYPGDQITDDTGDYFVGELAMSQLKAHEQTRLRGRTADENAMGNVFRLRLAKVAIGKLLAGSEDIVHVRIATGLPVDHMPDAPGLKQTLIGQHRIQTDACDFVANITEVMVMPQPYGTIYSRMIKANGQLNECHTATRTGVVDVGTYTVDLAMDDDGEYIDSMSGSVESGVYTAQESIAEAIERNHRQKPRYSVIETVLRTGRLTGGGKTISYAAEVLEALEPLKTATLALMSQKWANGLEVDAIYLSGGGAALVINDVIANYPQTVLVDNPQLANAIGYLNYARFKLL